MNAGKLDRRIQIKNKTITRDAYGAEVIVYEVFATVWAEMLPITGREYFAANQTVNESMVKFRIRYKTGFDESAIISYGGSDYDILYIAEIGRKSALEILVKKP